MECSDHFCDEKTIKTMKLWREKGKPAVDKVVELEDDMLIMKTELKNLKFQNNALDNDNVVLKNELYNVKSDLKLKVI